MIFSLTQVLIIVAIGVGAWFAGKKLFQVDTKVEGYRRSAGQLAASLKEMGFKELPEFFIDFSVGDKSGMLYKLQTIAQRLMQGEKAVLTELDDVFLKLLTIKLNTPEGRNLVETKLREVEAAIAKPSAPATKATS